MFLVNSNVCDNCNLIDHYLYECEPVRSFWASIEKWWNEVSTCPVVLSKKHVIFGIHYDLTYYGAVNYVILFGKMYIYRQKMNSKNLCIDFFINELKFKIELEKTMCKKNGNLSMFNQKWYSVKEELIELL